MSAYLAWGFFIQPGSNIHEINRNNVECLQQLFSALHPAPFNQVYSYANEVVATEDEEIFATLCPIPNRYVVLWKPGTREIKEIQYVQSHDVSRTYTSAEQIGFFQSCLGTWGLAPNSQEGAFYTQIISAEQLDRLARNAAFSDVKDEHHIVTAEDYRFTSLLLSGVGSGELIDLTATTLEQKGICLNRIWFFNNRQNIPAAEIKSLHKVMKGIAEGQIDNNTELDNISNQMRVSAQLMLTPAAGDGDCLFHSYTANILYAVFKEKPERDFINGVVNNLLHYVRIRAENLGINLPRGNDIPEIFKALIAAYPLQNGEVNVAALSHQVMVPALRAMIQDKKDHPNIRNIVLPLLKIAMGDADHSEFTEAFRAFLRENPNPSDDDLYNAYWEHQNEFGVFGSNIEYAVMDYLLGAKSHLVQTQNLALSGTPTEAGKANFYLRKTAAHFDAYLGVHPNHGDISENDKNVMRAISLDFTHTHSEPTEGTVIGFSQLKDRNPQNLPAKEESPRPLSRKPEIKTEPSPRVEHGKDLSSKRFTLPPSKTRSSLPLTRKDKENESPNDSGALMPLGPKDSGSSFIAPEKVLTDFFRAVSLHHLERRKDEEIIASLQTGAWPEQLVPAQETVAELIAQQQTEVTATLRERLTFLASQRDRELSDEEKEEIAAGDEKVAILEQLKEIEAYLEGCTKKSCTP